MPDLAFTSLRAAHLGGVDGEFRRGRVSAILGPSGAGKTTLLSVLAGRVPRTGGAITLDGEPADLRELRQLLGFATEEDALLPLLTTEETLDFAAAARLPSSVTRADRAVLVDRILHVLGLTHIRRARVGSGTASDARHLLRRAAAPQHRRRARGDARGPLRRRRDVRPRLAHRARGGVDAEPRGGRRPHRRRHPPPAELADPRARRRRALPRARRAHGLLRPCRRGSRLLRRPRLRVPAGREPRRLPDLSARWHAVAHRGRSGARRRPRRRSRRRRLRRHRRAGGGARRRARGVARGRRR